MLYLNLLLAAMASTVSHMANEPLRDQTAGKLGWSSRVCAGARIIGNIGVNNSRDRPAISPNLPR
jgi:hypothetical protein